MKKMLLLLSMAMLLMNTTVAGDLVIDNFDNKAIGTTYSLKAWYATDGTATVATDPANASNKAINIVTSNWDALLQLSVTLPAGMKLSDYTGFSFDIYIPTNANDQNANHKNMHVFLDGVKKYEDTDFPKQAEIATWTTKTFTIASLNLTDAEKAKTSFTIAFGISTDKGNYYIDNVKLTGGSNGGGTTNGGSLLITDFSSSNIGDKLGLKAWYDTDGTATVTADPANASNKVVNIVTVNWDALLQLNVTLPAGKKLSDYDSFSFDIYIPTNANDQNANHKNMHIFLDGVKKYEDTDFPKQAEIATWTTKTYTIASLNLTDAEKAKTSFTIAFGISTDKGNYFIDNVKLNGSGDVVDPSGATLVVADFNTNAVGQTFGMKAWYETDGTATVTADPANASNKVVNIVTSNWDALLKLNVVLPAGKTLNHYKTFSFDIYIPTNASDQNANHKNMHIFLDGVKKYEDADFPKQAEISTWTPKTYDLTAMNLTSAELAKSSFDMAFGISTDKGNYYIDNVKLIEKAGPISSTPRISDNVEMYVADNALYLTGGAVGLLQLYTMSGSLVLASNNQSWVDVSTLPVGVYIVRAFVDGVAITSKFIK